MTPYERPTVLRLSGPIVPADIPGLCEHVRSLLEARGAGPVVCDVADLDDPDAVTVDALARLQLVARRLGRRVEFLHARSELLGLVSLMGLGDVLPCVGEGSGLEPGR